MTITDPIEYIYIQWGIVIYIVECDVKYQECQELVLFDSS